MDQSGVIKNTPEAWSERASIATSYGAALWSRAGQEERFKAVRDALEPRSDEVLLDYGCGTGEFSEYLADDVGYLGFDWARKMVLRAQWEHPSREFTTREPMKLFDLVVCIGPFNLVDNWSKHETWATVDALWKRSNPRAMAVSLYAGEDTDCLIYDHNEIIEQTGGLGSMTTVLRPRENDLTFVMYK